MKKNSLSFKKILRRYKTIPLKEVSVFTLKANMLFSFIFCLTNNLIKAPCPYLPIQMYSETRRLRTWIFPG